ncbi:hypothetical protein ACWEVD_14575 [Nocardia thailandica]|uniref:hypothetical protein n=1 Tax=Nocardia thailandica TaxID=257275 RepID=UPI0014613A91|nr:hypothetical protein [Nocardia thailandica]
MAGRSPENNSTITGSDAEITTCDTISVAAQRLTGHPLGEAPKPRHTYLRSANYGEELERARNSACSDSDYGDNPGPISQISNSGSTWIYDQKLKKHRHHCQFSGQVVTIQGSEANRLRDELAEIIRELLEWATREKAGEQFLEDGEAA